MDTILDMKKVFLSSVCFCLLLTDFAWDNIFFFCLCWVIALECRFGKMAPVTAIMDEILYDSVQWIFLYCMHLEFAHHIKYKNGLLSPCDMHVYIYLNQMMIETTSLLLKTHSIYPVVVEDIDIHYKTSLYLYGFYMRT